MPASRSGSRTSWPRSPSQRRGVAGQLGRLVALVVQEDPDDGHGVASARGRAARLGRRRRRGRRRAGRRARSAGAVRAWTRNSTFPSAPVIGDTIAPMMAAPRPRSASTTSSSTRRHTSGSRITPRPRDASARPASNCGFTSSTRSAPGRGQGHEAGEHRPQRDERQVGHDQRERRAEVAGRQVADVGALVHLDAVVGPQALVELAVADVDGDHPAPRPAGAGSR